jgi:flagellar motor switch protein FliN
MPTLTEALDPLGSKLAGLLAASLGTLTALPPDEEATTQPGDPVSVVLRFEGALAGECTLRVSAGALSIAVGAADAADSMQSRLEQLLDPLTEPLAEALFPRYGRIRIQRLPGDAATSSSSSAVAALRGAAALEIVLLADEQLAESLGRLGRASAAAEASGLFQGNLGLVMDVELEVTLRFGQRQLSLREVLELSSGSVVELESQVDEPVELLLDGRVIARGEAVIVDGNYGVRITEVLHPVAA